MTRLPYQIEHHPGPRGRRAVRRFCDLLLELLELLEFLLAPQADLSIHPKDKP